MTPLRVGVLLRGGRISVFDTGVGLTPSAGGSSEFPEQVHDVGFIYHGGVVRILRSASEATDLDAIPDPEDPELEQYDGRAVEGCRVELYVAHDLVDNEVLWIFWRFPRDVPHGWEGGEN